MADSAFEDGTHLTELVGTEAIPAIKASTDCYTTPDDISNNYVVRYIFVITVAGSDLTVALKHIDGTNPSTSVPVRVRVGPTERVLTSALSVTANDGTNWCNAGDAAFATKDVGYFIYLGFNITDGVTIGFSRIPGANKYGDFSATTTNERFCKINDITSAGAADVYSNQGYFEAKLSAAAGYDWSLTAGFPIFYTPTHSTRWLDYSPTPTGYSGTPTVTCRYKIDYRTAHVSVYVTGTSDTVNKTVPLPLSASGDIPFRQFHFARIADNSVSALGTCDIEASDTDAEFFPDETTGAWTNTGTATLWSVFSYEI